MANKNTISYLFKNDETARELISTNIALWNDCDKDIVKDYFTDKNLLSSKDVDEIEDTIKNLNITTLLSIPSSLYDAELEITFDNKLSSEEEDNLVDKLIGIVEKHKSFIGGGSSFNGNAYCISWVLEVPYDSDILELKKDIFKEVNKLKPLSVKDNFENVSPPFNILKAFKDGRFNDKDLLLENMYDNKLLSELDIEYISEEFFIPKNSLIEIYKNFCNKEVNNNW